MEIVKFKSKPGIGLEEFKIALQSLDKFVRQQPGFISRKLGVDDQGRWWDLVAWTDLQAARTAADLVMQSEECLAVFALMDEESIEMNHIETQHSVNGSAA